MDSTVDSILTTTPFRRPIEGFVPMPMMFILSPDASPTTEHILVVPISRPTITSPCILYLLLISTRGFKSDGIYNNAVYIVEINAIEIRKISFLLPIYQDVFEHGIFERVIVIS